MPHQWNWQLLRAGSLRLDGGGMFGVVPKTLWSKFVTPDEQNRIPLQTNCLVLDDGTSKILIETGFGDKWTEKERGFFELEHRTVVDALREINLEPRDIDHVIVSHLHFDHAAGLTRNNSIGAAVATFPNADVYVQQTEWDDALANKSTMTRTYLRNHLDPIENRVRLVKGEGEILPGISVWPLPGHTWGQQGIRFHDQDGVVCFIGDVIPTINHIGLAFSIGYDMMPYENMQMKKRVLDEVEAKGWRIALDHEPGDAVMCVKKDVNRPGQFVFEKWNRG